MAATGVLELTRSHTDIADEHAAKYRVSADLHPDDYILAYQMGLRGAFEGVEAYFRGGSDDADKIRKFMAANSIKKDARVLEFASGYGRITRHLKNDLENLTVCDIHPEAVKFTSERLGVRSILSSAIPAELKTNEKFDFIFVVSLFSHLPEHTFGAWLSKLYSMLAPGGVLNFSTHGEFAAERDATIKKLIDCPEGFGFSPHSEQEDLDTATYGTAAISTRRCIQVIHGSTAARVKDFVPGGWWRFQDEWVIEKPATERKRFRIFG